MNRNCQIKPSLQEFRQPLGRHEAELSHSMNHFTLFSKDAVQSNANETALSQQFDHEMDLGFKRS